MTTSSGVGGIEAEAVMLGQPISMVLPEVIGYYLKGTPEPLITSTDIVLTITKVTAHLSRLTHTLSKLNIIEDWLVVYWLCVCSQPPFKRLL